MTETLIATRKWKPPCQAEDCGRTARTAGYCPRHYQQVRRHGRLTPEHEYHSRNGICCSTHCPEPEIAKGYCFRHYQQIRRYGRLTPERERLYGRTTCLVPGCDERHAARGYCKKHYMKEYYLPRQDENDPSPELASQMLQV
jgi:hypothetical protein